MKEKRARQMSALKKSIKVLEKRLLSLAMCLVMALSIMPSTAFAASPSGDTRAVYAETDDCSMRAVQVMCYDGYYFINYPKACSIVRMKMDGSDIKQIVDTAGLGLLTNLNSLYSNTTITDKSNLTTWFIDIACYNCLPILPIILSLATMWSSR